MKKVLPIALATAMTINIAAVPTMAHAEETTTVATSTAATAHIQRFDLQTNPLLDQYKKAFSVNDHITSITNNGGQYASSALKYALDGDTTTHWETGKPNSDTFTN